jgi:4-hydroxythreonine-4-phosphate dehydrogenase
MGDPAGIGPEIIAGVWADPRLHDWCSPLVVGHPDVMRRACALVATDVQVLEVQSPQVAAAALNRMPCLPACRAEAVEAPPGIADARGGQAAYDALVAAAKLALEKRIDAIVTAPLSKAALWAAGHHYPGHTELLAELCGVHDFAMMLYLGPDEQVRGLGGLGVVHVTLHMRLRDALATLSSEAVLSKIRLVDAAMRPFLAAGVCGDMRSGATGGSSTSVGATRVCTGGQATSGTHDVPALAPRIGVCAVNPHAGESGLFGDEETRIIVPAVADARAHGIDAEGPYPADTLMARARDGAFDAVVAMYHDQGHIALKLLGMHRAVNVTLGLPIVRTSVAHGTAFDIAWQGRARTTSMIEAIRVVCVRRNAKC